MNHHLRNDSDIDESFVSILGSKLNIETYIRHLNPKMMSRGESVESWARNGRYDLLENIKTVSYTHLTLPTNREV